jgi:hypothetical protein
MIRLCITTIRICVTKMTQLQQRVTWRSMYDSELPLLEGESDGGLLGGVQGGVEPAQLPTAVQQPGRQARMRFARLTVCARQLKRFAHPLTLMGGGNIAVLSTVRTRIGFNTCESVFRIHDILVWIRIRIRGSMPLTNGSGSFYFFTDLQDANKKLILKKSFPVYYFFKVLVHYFQK